MSANMSMRQSGGAEGSGASAPLGSGGKGAHGKRHDHAHDDGRCKVCQGLLDEDNSQSKEHIEKSTRVILGLLSHYSDTLLGVIKRGPPGGTAMKNKAGETDSDEEEEKKTFCTPFGITVTASLGSLFYILALYLILMGTGVVPPWSGGKK